MGRWSSWVHLQCHCSGWSRHGTFDDEDLKRATVVVPDSKLSLAIGRRGQNVRLAAHLTGYRIDIKSASEYDRLEAEKKQQQLWKSQLLTMLWLPRKYKKRGVWCLKSKIPLRKSLVSGEIIAKRDLLRIVKLRMVKFSLIQLVNKMVVVLISN